MAFEESSDDTGFFWKRLARFKLLFDSRLCVPECSMQPECVEHCRALSQDEEESDAMEDPGGTCVARTDPGLPQALAPSHPQALAPSLGGQGQFTLRWADLQGMSETAGDNSLGLMHHSVLPLTTTAQQTSGLPAPRFKRGIQMKAYLYKPDKSDAIDVQLHKNLQSLDSDSLNVLALRRIETGQYEIDGRQVRIYRGGADGMQLLVHEDDVAAGIADMPLRAYINLVANVAMSLHRRGLSPSFSDVGTATHDDDNDNRYKAMRLACTQAELRDSSKYYRSLY